MKNPLQTLRCLVKQKCKSQEEFGAQFDRGQSLISKKLAGKVPWQPRDLIIIERFSNGKISPADLRPDLCKLFRGRS